MRFRPLLGLLLAAAGLWAVPSPAVAGDDLMVNTDFARGCQGWHGDGHVVYLKPDGSEGDENDLGAIPVMKIALEHYQAHAVYQALNTHPVLAKVQVSLEVFASADFQRAAPADSVVMDAPTLMQHDFMIQVNPDSLQTPADLQVGQWTTVNASFELLKAANDRGIYFLVPPGKGFVYLRKVSVTP
jgi:hypothetical protein